MRVNKDEKIDKEKIEEDLLENVEKATEDVDSNKLMDEVISNVDKSEEQAKHQEKNATEFETTQEEDESEEELEEDELSVEEEDDEPKTHGKTKGSLLKLAVGKNLAGRMKELIKEAKEPVGVATEESGIENEFRGLVICMEDCDDSTFTLHNDMIEGKIGNTGEECGVLDKQCEKGNCTAVELGHKEPKAKRSTLKHPEEERKKWKEGCEKELRDFNRREMWRKMKMKDTPEGRKLIESKWVFKLKRNSVYHDRLVALGCA